MSVWTDVKESTAWSRAYELPVIPNRSNPWIYTAYVYRIIRDMMSALETAEFNSSLRIYFATCEVTSGFVSKWPGDPGATSHDELLGAAYLSGEFAGRALTFLEKNDGAYTVGEPTIASNVLRFVFVVPYLKARAGYRVGLFSQACFSVLVLWDAFVTKPGEANDTLKIWLCYPAMVKYPLTAFALGVWEDRWMKRDYTPKRIFQSVYLTEVPILSKYAREDFK